MPGSHSTGVASEDAGCSHSLRAAVCSGVELTGLETVSLEPSLVGETSVFKENKSGFRIKFGVIISLVAWGLMRDFHSYSGSVVSDGEELVVS